MVTRPPVVASPNACVSRSNSPQFTPAWARARRAAGIDPDALHGPQVDHQPASTLAVAGHRVATAADRDRQPALRAERQRRHDVGHARWPRDQRRPAASNMPLNSALARW